MAGIIKAVEGHRQVDRISGNPAGVSLASAVRISSGKLEIISIRFSSSFSTRPAIIQCCRLIQFFTHLANNAADSGMGILHIKDRIIIGLLNRQVQIKVKMTVRRAQIEEKAGRINADLVDEISQGNGFSCRLDILATSPLRSRRTSCMITTSKLAASMPTAVRAPLSRATWPWWSSPQTIQCSDRSRG